ncbi:MAG: 16S rRNA (cytosine(1402)-N(4))-methyltransferase [Omnitrophica bacterium RBG_13_46_9]|nr:MAG: 16S rRNA (cytosine(1402)-N(4))-methyltransferase [Omnitrophica bacterium RBG_13_46_9]
MKNNVFHKPVMADEVIGFLRLKKGDKVLDATVGCGGHASLILEKIQPDGLLIAVDLDQKALDISQARLGNFSTICKCVHRNFSDIDEILPGLGVDRIDGALFDLGISSYQIEDSGRGFSFERNGFLDMRMDLAANTCAYDIVNRYSKHDLEAIIRDFGQERYYRKITGFILERRRKSPITSSQELSWVIGRAVGGRYKKQRIHPATRTFQAIRIAVNDELENIDRALVNVVGFLKPKARLCVISFHSLEDRIVKIRFKEFEKSGKGRIITKKPMAPAACEIRENPRARSAKLRVFEGK